MFIALVQAMQQRIQYMLAACNLERFSCVAALLFCVFVFSCFIVLPGESRALKISFWYRECVTGL